MRIYARSQVCGFRFSREIWGELSNFRTLTASIVAGPCTFGTSEALYQACKFAAPRISSRESLRRRRREPQPPSAARRVLASTPTGTRNAST